MALADKRIFLDTNVVIECFRIGVSLEELLKLAKVAPAKLDLVGPQHTASFLGEVRTKVFLGIIP